MSARAFDRRPAVAISLSRALALLVGLLLALVPVAGDAGDAAFGSTAAGTVSADSGSSAVTVVERVVALAEHQAADLDPFTRSWSWRATSLRGAAAHGASAGHASRAAVSCRAAQRAVKRARSARAKAQSKLRRSESPAARRKARERIDKAEKRLATAVKRRASACATPTPPVAAPPGHPAAPSPPPSGPPPGSSSGPPAEPPNGAPSATAQSVATNEDTAALITLAGTDPDGDPLGFKLASLPGHGTLFHGDSTAPADRIISATMTLSGSQVTYLPDAGYHGPDAFQFRVNDGTVDSAAATVSLIVHPVGDPADPQALANQVLALPQRVPGEIDLFTSVFLPSESEGLYPAGTAMAPVDGTPPSEAEVRPQLAAYLNRWFDGDSARVGEALALFDSDDVKALLADPTHRAAFAAMRGTLLEPTIDPLLTSGRFAEVRWGGLPNSVIAAVSGDPVRVAFNRRHSGDRFEYLIGVMGHEILHGVRARSGGSTRAEEVILNGLTAMTHMQVLSKSPELAYRSTELTRSLNDYALLFTNSREAGSPNSELYAPSGLGVAPGSPHDTTDFWSLPFIGAHGTSPGSEPLRTILQSVLAPGAPVPAMPDYSQASAELFEHLNDDWLSDVQRAQISVLLQLVTVEEIVQATGLGEQEIIDMLGLQPYLDAIP